MELFARSGAWSLRKMIERPGWAVHCGDSLDLLRRVPDAVVDALVTDPPAGIGFMGKDWDDYRRSHNKADVGRANAFGRASRTAPEIGRADRSQFVDSMRPIFRECLRTMKPGAHGLVWALPRTSHWTAVALEDAGFEIRDRVSHLFGSGFPKSVDLGDGRGTALKPGGEDWWLVRAPLIGTVSSNVEAHGTGALNIDACRLPFSGADDEAESKAKNQHADNGGKPMTNAVYGEYSKPRDNYDAAGRWPPHVILDECAEAQLGESGRFFYCPKGSTSEKEAGCDDLPLVQVDDGREADAAGANNPRNRGGAGRRNHHPTVKSINLMRWLVRLITPPGGMVLDVFAGSGTTVCASILEGRDCLAFEQKEAYAKIAEHRARYWQQQKGQTT